MIHYLQALSLYFKDRNEKVRIVKKYTREYDEIMEIKNNTNCPKKKNCAKCPCKK